MPAPQNDSEHQTFLGFIQYLGKFLSNLSEVSSSFRTLLEKDVYFHWDTPQEESSICCSVLLVTHQSSVTMTRKNTLTLTVDSSSKCLGAAFELKGHYIVYGSRALTKRQKNYALIEKEALAISYDCNKLHQCVFGLHITVESNNKPLQAIL